MKRNQTNYMKRFKKVEKMVMTKQPPAKQVGLLKNAGIARQKLTPMAQISQNLNSDSPLCGLPLLDT